MKDINGKLIAISGLDGSGKSTCIDGVLDELNQMGKTVAFFDAMKPGIFNPELRKVALKKKNQFDCFSPDLIGLSYALDLLDTYESKLIPSLEEGKTVLVHRYDLCGLTYSEAMGAKTSLIKLILQNCRKPDLHIYLKVESEKAYQRVVNRARQTTIPISDNGTAYVLSQAAKSYLENIQHDKPFVKIIDGNLKPPEVRSRVLNEILAI